MTLPSDHQAPLESSTERGDLEAAGRWLEESRRWFEAGLEGFLARTELGPPALSEALEYALLGGGKRVRPALVRLLGGDHAAPADLVQFEVDRVLTPAEDQAAVYAEVGGMA